ncbi:MAG: NAD-dependent epimerase/dehydratase family protein [Paludibacteraceae bacterium]|nr:NAD-dependent epimerase/dehydratase family protein [Paludibacteraceae bacterium]
MKTTVFLTGATGTMGFAGMKEILSYPDQYNLRILARPSQKNKTKLAPFLNGNYPLEVVWGDLTSYEDVLKGVTGANIVLHVGGMVSPQADYRPTATRKTNLTAAANIRDAVLAQPKDQQPKVVYIGSVAQMGDRREPLHWGRTGDPICVSAYDHYGITKALAERIITNSPIEHWVSLRQSGILYPAILKNYDPIMFHVPIRGVLEWATVEDSGRLLERVCRPEVPEEFWNRYYNIGSGDEYRISNYEFECLLLDAIGCPKPEKIFNAQWFTTRNFHGMWYIDGDDLENYLHFRANVPIKEYFKQMAKSDTLPSSLKFAVRSKLVYLSHLVPHIVKLAMRFMANSVEHGTQWWIKNNKTQRIAAYYGTKEAYNAIPDWAHTDLSHNSTTPVVMDHGYDETKDIDTLTDEELNKAAQFRGGKYLGNDEWECACGHRFKASRRFILLGGQWCPECFPYPYNEPLQRDLGFDQSPRPWDWDAEAKRNPFFAQLWAPLHDKDEHNTFGPEVFNGWEK